jgi:threonine synthase
VPFIEGLRCRECARTYPAEALHVCEFCFGPLEVSYDYEAITASVSRERIAAGPQTIWRYADRLAAELGLGELWVKNDTVNPTGSFKDRVVSVALTKARELGFKVAACASTGNLANSVAAHAASAGMRSIVFIPHDLEAGKVVTTAVYSGQLLAVEGTYDDVNRLCAELTSEHPSWAFVNVNVRTYYAEGSKTLAFEVAEQLGWRAPDHVVVPIASGSQLVKIGKGFKELHRVGLLDDEPAVRISGAQAAGCSPVATAFAEGVDHVRPVRPSTIAKSLAIGNPADGWYALDTVRSTGGAVGSVTDDEIVEGIRLLARTEGIFAETAGGVTIATLAKLAAEGVVRPDERVVAYVTGHGLKTIEAVSPCCGPTATIAPTLDAFAGAIDVEDV